MIGLTICISYTIDGFSCGEGKRKHVLANSLKQAQGYVRAAIDGAGIGASDWSGGELRLDGKAIGHISYNGRAWHTDGEEMAPSAPVLGPYAVKAAKASKKVPA